MLTSLVVRIVDFCSRQAWLVIIASLLITIGCSIYTARHFAINYLGRDALALADMFAGKSAIKGAARFEQGRWGTLTTGAPVFADAIGVLDCELEKTIEHFATTIAIGRVVDLVARGSGDPLIYFRGGFYSG